MELKIYDKANNLRLTASPNTSSSVTEEIGGECSVSASFTHTEYIPLDVDDYIELEGVRYKVKSRYRPKQKNTQTYEYSVKFYAPIHDAEDTLMLFQEGGTTSEFSYDGGPREHLQLWIDNMNRRAGGNLWSIGTVITADNKTIDYRNVKCWDAAFGSNGIAATFETEMWADGYAINLCKAERGEMVELGYLQGLTNLAQEDNGEVKFFTRLFPLGSTRNIDATKYGYSRLQLPDRSIYVDKNVDLYGVKEETEETAFSEIYPKYIGTVSSVRTEEKTSEEGRKYTVYYFKDNGMNWNPKDYEIPDLDYMLKFQTGELAGRGTDGSFQAAWHEDTREWEIINVYPDDTTQIPGGAIIPQPGDQYIPWNFAMPQEYITEAEQEYKQAVDDYLNTYSFDPNKYTGTTDRNYIEKNHTPLHIGWNVRLLSDQYFGAIGGYKDTRITKVQRKLNDLCQATITCSDEVGTGWKSSVDNSLDSLRYEVAKQAEQYVYDIIKSFETKTPSDNNVFSALKSLKTLLRKDQSDSTNFLLKLLGGAEFGVFASGISGANIDAQGAAELLSLVLRGALTIGEYKKGLKGANIDEQGVADLLSILVRSGIESANFSTGALGAGFCLKKDENGDSYLEVDRMLVRKVATFIRLLIQQIKHVGGQIILTPASMSCVKIEDKGDFYRCYFENTDGERTIEQEFVVGDLARAQTFNVKEGVNENVTNTYYWRAVVGTGDNYIDLSKTDCDTGSTEPKAGDDIVQLGNKSDATRQAAIILSAYGNDAPYFKLYRGINSYSLDGKEFASFSRSEVMIIADAIKFSSGESVKDYIDNAVGEVNTKLDDVIADLSENISFVNQLSKDLESVKNQVDGAIETWFYDPVPTLSNEPAVNWTKNEDKNVHLGDLYYDGNGKAYRFQMEGSTYVWQVITDSDITKALADAKAAQDTADGKRRVFVTTPTNSSEYDVGDLWVNATYGEYVNDLLRCNTAKEANAVFSIDHWELASKYTDDTKANQAIEDAANAKVAAESAQADADEAKERLDSWASDGVISPTEKQSMKDEITRIDADKEQIANGYTKYSLGTPTAYNNAYTAYRAVLVTLTASSPETISIPSDFSTKQTAYYTQRTAALTAISNAARDYAQGIANDLNSYKQTVSSQFEQTNNSITAAVTSSKKYTDSAVSGIQIGGRNYFAFSRTKIKNISGTGEFDKSINGAVLTTGSNSTSKGIVRFNNFGLTDAGDYTLSCEIKATSDVTIKIDICDYTILNNIAVTNQYKKIKLTGRVASYINGDGGYYGFVDFDEVSDIPDGVKIYIKNFKLESGNKPTAWTPAPEDAENALTEYKKEVTAQFSVLEGEISSKVSSTEMTTIKQEILNSAASDATTKANNAKNEAISTAATDATNKANQAKNDAITTAGQNADKKYATITTVSSMQTSITQLSNSLSLKAEKSEVTAVQNNLNQTNNNLSALTTRVSKAEVALEPDNIWIGISSKVTTTGKINSIVPDSCFDDTNYSLLYSGGSRVSAATANNSCPTNYCMKSSSNTIYSTSEVNVNVGEKYYVTAMVNAEKCNYKVTVGLRIKLANETYKYIDIDGVEAKTKGWKTISGYITIPSNAISASISFTISGTSNLGTAYFTKVYAYKVDESVNQNYALLTSSEKRLTTFNNIENQRNILYKTSGLKKGDIVTISFEYEASNLIWSTQSGKESSLKLQFDDKFGWTRFMLNIKSNGNGKVITSPMTLGGNDTNIKDSYIEIVFNNIASVLQNNNPIGYFRVWNLKVEKGERATPWSAAPSDYSTTEEIKSGIGITKNEVSIFGKKISLSGMITFSSCDSDLQSTINSKADSSDITASKDDIAKKLGYSSYADMVNKAYAGNTIINGGYIRTSLIEADALVVKTLNAVNAKGINTLVDKEGITLTDSSTKNVLLKTEIIGTSAASYAGSLVLKGGFSSGRFQKANLSAFSLTMSSDGGGTSDKYSINLSQYGLQVFTNSKGLSRPRIIWCGYISESGIISRQYGNYLNVRVKRNSTGSYTVTHNIGMSAYYPFVNPVLGGFICVAQINNMSSNSFLYTVANANDGAQKVVDAPCMVFIVYNPSNIMDA